ncbi:MAG: hypothetical protein K0B08_04185 [Bacteroidales bacterium]|nr:hypothetical protein [Bacteroidales bacterium]
MKTKSLLIIALLAVGLCSQMNGQYARSDIFSYPEITWFGLDFTHIKLIGPEGFTNPAQIQDIYFREINNLFKYEPDKYDLRKTFSKKVVNIDLEMMHARNRDIDPYQLVLESGAVYNFDKETVAELIADYDLEDMEGIGLVFVMESFNKDQDMGYMWVTFFDVGTREIILTDKMRGKAGGFGWRNYWAKSVYNVLLEIQKTRYKTWSRY